MPLQKSRENRLRRQLWKHFGCQLRKSRASFSIDNLGGYSIIYQGALVAGERFELDLDDVEQFIRDHHAEEPEA